MSVQLRRVLMPEEASRVAPMRPDTHSIAECDVMLALPLAPKVADAWMDERLLAMHDRSIAQSA